MRVFLESDRSAGDKPQPSVVVVFDSIDELARCLGFVNAEAVWERYRTISEAVFGVWKGGCE